MSDRGQLKVRLTPQRKREVEALARARGVAVHDIVEEALALLLGPGEALRRTEHVIATIERGWTAWERRMEDTDAQIRLISDFVADICRDPEGDGFDP